MRISRAERARDQIIAHFDNLPQQVFTLQQLSSIFEDQREVWGLPKTLTTKRFIRFLGERTKLWNYTFSFPSQSTILFFWDSPELYEVAMQLRPTGYLSHLTAMQYHNLIDEEDTERLIYINVEQSPKPSPHGMLEQSRIDAAFQRPPRVTTNQAQIGDYTFYLLSGKNTNMIEVQNETVPGIARPVRITSLERTLVDIVVRPAYSGGIRRILEAYVRASERVNVEHLARTLQQLQYVYPYHQAIGFFMERSQRYTKEQLDVFHQHPKKFDFYADYQITEPEYSSEWRIYYPRNLALGTD